MRQSDSEERASQLRQAAAEDLRLLAHLHGGELTNDAIAELQRGAFGELLGVVPASAVALEALAVIDAALRELAAGTITQDELAADFTDIYLTHRLQLSPSESPWLDEDGLTNGQPMFAVRDWYMRFGLGAENWRLRGDDHLCLQLLFIAHLLEGDEPALAAAGRFMDQHLLRWLPRFATGVAQRCATPFYAGLAMLTLAHAEALRDLIETLTGEPREVCAEDAATNREGPAGAPPSPTGGPGW